GHSGDVAVSELIIRFKPGAGLNAKFAARYMAYLFVTGHWRERASGASGSMKKSGRGQLSATLLPVPQLSRQQCEVEHLDRQLGAAEKLHASLSAQLRSEEHTSELQ